MTVDLLQVSPVELSADMIFGKHRNPNHLKIQRAKLGESLLKFKYQEWVRALIAENPWFQNKVRVVDKSQNQC